MSKTYSTIPTRIGAAKLRNASILNTTVKIVKVAFGDGGGSEYEPTGEETSLKRQTYFTVPNYIKEEGSSPTWVEMEAVIPHNVGGWYLREFCCYDEEDDVIFIGNLPESYKPSGDAGVIKDLVFEMVYDAVAANVVSLKIDANVVIASRKFVEDQIKTHKEENNPHPNVFPKSYTDSEIGNKWLMICDVVYADFFSLEVVGGSDLEGSNEFFSCDILFSFFQYGAGGNYRSPKSLIVTKTLGVNNPRFHTVKLSDGKVQLWMEITSNKPFPVSVLVKNKNRSQASKAGILSITNQPPEGAILVPYDTGEYWSKFPVGVPVPVLGPLPSNKDSRFRYVVLSDGHPYNNGILINKEVSGEHPNLVIKYTVNMESSPIHGEKVEMLNTMEAMIQPSVSSGLVFKDKIRNIAGHFYSTVAGSSAFAMPAHGHEGVFSPLNENTVTREIQTSSNVINTKTGLAFNASRVVPTGPRVQSYAIGFILLMRIQ